jgi:V/A-type H+-transporting ATPase subunit E
VDLLSGERIIRRILEEAESEKKQIENEADNSIALLLAEGRAKAEEKYSEIMDSAKKEREMAVNRILAQARLKARETVRSARDDIISLCFDRAEDEILQIRHSERYPSVLEFLIENGIRELGEKRVILDICPEDRGIIQEMIPEFEKKGYHIVVSPDPVVSEGGLIIRSDTRSVHVNNTFEARLQRYRKEILYEVAEILVKTEAGGITDGTDD